MSGDWYPVQTPRFLIMLRYSWNLSIPVTEDFSASSLTFLLFSTYALLFVTSRAVIEKLNPASTTKTPTSMTAARSALIFPSAAWYARRKYAVRKAALDNIDASVTPFSTPDEYSCARSRKITEQRKAPTRSFFVFPRYSSTALKLIKRTRKM